MHANLLIETTDPQSFEYIIEEKNSNSEPTVYIKGPYAQATNDPSKANKNKRMYCPQEMEKEVNRYNEHMVKTKRALGELNHPQTPDVDLERACHMVVELYADKSDPDIYIGKSKVLSTPTGCIVSSLIRDGCSIGMSTRSLGKLMQVEGHDNVSKVQDLRLVAVDCVADPSFGDAFVNGILESKQYILNKYGDYVEAYESLENGLSNLPKKDVEDYIKTEVFSFIETLKKGV